ncbi:MAG: hypothetical protein U0457_12750 [Candidatus Sericytochromatia bacterium]
MIQLGQIVVGAILGIIANTYKEEIGGFLYKKLEKISESVSNYASDINENKN